MLSHTQLLAAQQPLDSASTVVVVCHDSVAQGRFCTKGLKRVVSNCYAEGTGAHSLARLLGLSVLPGHWECHSLQWAIKCLQNCRRESAHDFPITGFFTSLANHDLPLSSETSFPSSVLPLCANSSSSSPLCSSSGNQFLDQSVVTELEPVDYFLELC